MIWLCVALIVVSFGVSLPATALVRRMGLRLGTLDGAGVAGQVKAPARRVPNTGGVGIFAGIALPMLAGLAFIWCCVDHQTLIGMSDWLEPLHEHFVGIRQRTGDAVVLLAALLLLHVMGLFDDRRPLGAYPKLAIMLAAAAGVAWLTDSRMLTLLDSHVGGPWLSFTLTVLWIGVVTNAFNFLDNMDGLSAGVAAIASAFFLAGTLASPQPQWFVAACLALLIGSLLGFLVFNFPLRKPATIFMGDGGSLVVGFLLAILTVRTTYVAGAATGADPAAVSLASHSLSPLFMPLVVLAIPLYDFCSVTVIRLRQGKSPFVGDLQHFSHRLVQRGLSKRSAVLVIYGCTAVTAIGGVSLPRLLGWQAALVGVQTLLVLSVLALYEWSSTRPQADPSESQRAHGGAP
ncbi:MAG: MraY family glycosyltransferase [Phycisphaerales bacterium]